MTVLDVRRLARTYGGFRLGPVDLSVDDEVLAVLGPSGCGKTTLLSLIAGIARPDEGSVSLDGRSLDGRPPEERGAGLVFQDGALFPHMTAGENVAYAAADPDRAADLAATLEIDHLLDRRAANLSGGERQRVALARALAADPDALLLDEPLANLDAPIRRRLRGELRDLFDALGIPVVYVTHDQRAATALGDRIAVLRAGRIEQVGTAEEVLRRPATAFVASFTGCENLLDATVVGRDAAGIELDVGGATVRASDENSERNWRVGDAATACIRPARVRIEKRSSTGERGSASERGSIGGSDPDSTAVGFDPTADNVLAGTVRRWLREGDDYRVAVEVGGAEGGAGVDAAEDGGSATADGGIALAAAVPPVEFEAAGFDRGAPVRVAIDPGAIHATVGESEAADARNR